MKTIIAEDFNLPHTLASGQIFRIIKHDNFFYILTNDEVFKAKQQGNKLYFDGVSRKFLTNFFRLDEDHAFTISRINKDAHMERAIAYCHGLRIIRQDPWECTISFLCSSASNIPKIQMNLFNLSKLFGKKLEYDGMAFYTFPQPGKINNIQKIRAAKTGFRAAYIKKVNSFLNEEAIARIVELPYPLAKQSLMRLPGIGEKIADCVSLFSLDHLQAFPVDTWIRKSMQELYLHGNPKEKEIATFAQDYFGELAGYAQQYLFHYMRMIGKEKK
ncbi:DNA-3-methyladenine glycosylase 2 family protein [Candidatus Woesearchaeota archaeon]|nr:DNA-3-methyladenine glycosylase 2 family protein [Candidatus Woesearchaeota archaeon]